MYEASTTTVTDALKTSSSAVFSDDTISKILALTTKGTTDTSVRFDDVNVGANGAVTVAAGAEVVYVKSSDTGMTTVTAPTNVPVVIFQGQGGVSATFNDGPTTVLSGAGVVDRVVVGTAAADNIVIGDHKNSQIIAGAGDTVVGGAGHDTIVAGLGNSTVVGGTGQALAQMAGHESDYAVTVVDGHAVVKNKTSNVTTDISKIQYVQLDDGKALVFAKDTTEAAVTALYQTLFGRTADANGLQFWFDAAKSGVSLNTIAQAFTSSAEFKSHAAADDSQWVADLYQNTFGRAADQNGLAYWTAALKGGASRADIAEQFSHVAAQNIDGTVHTEATVVGSVTIVHNIV